MMSRPMSPAGRVAWIALVVALILPLAAPARAAVSSSLVVDSTGDNVDASPGDGVCRDATDHCTLRAALQEANALAGADIVTFSVNGTITLTSSLQAITDDLTIIGNGVANTIIDANGSHQGLNIGGGLTVNLIGMSIENGNASDGGGLYNAGTLLVSNASISNNHASSTGGGISNAGTLTVTNSTLSANSAGAIAAGIFNTGALTIINSTFVGNHASVDDGAILNNGTLTVTNSTFSGNSGGFIGGIHNYQGNATLNNTIVANSIGSADCGNDAGTLNASHNLIGNGLGCISGTNIANVTGDPLLGPLADNGGPTQTMLPGDGSPVINTGDNALALDSQGSPLTTDQRGVARIVGGTVDMGAVEAQSPVPNEIFGNGFD